MIGVDRDGDEMVYRTFAAYARDKLISDIPEIRDHVERELGAEDTHREAVIEQALYYSLNSSGLLKESEEVDLVKLALQYDGLMSSSIGDVRKQSVQSYQNERDALQLLLFYGYSLNCRKNRDLSEQSLCIGRG